MHKQKRIVDKQLSAFIFYGKQNLAFKLTKYIHKLVEYPKRYIDKHSSSKTIYSFLIWPE